MTHPLAERTAAWFRVRRHPVILTGLALVALQLLTRGWALSSNWFYTDDYALLRDAGTGLSGSYLLDPLNSHLMPGTRLLAWLVAQSGPLNWPLAASITLALQALASLAALWMLLGLFGRRWGVLALLVVTSPRRSPPSRRCGGSARLTQLPVQLAFFVASAAWCATSREPQARGGSATALAGLVVGLLFYVKALLVLPLLAFLLAGLLQHGGGPRARVAGPAAAATGRLGWSPWCGLPVYYLPGFHTATSAAVHQAERRRLPPRPGRELDGRDALITGALGGPWPGPPSGRPCSRRAAAVGDPAVLVVTALPWRRPRASGADGPCVAWALLAGYLVGVYVLLVASRAWSTERRRPGLPLPDRRGLRPRAVPGPGLPPELRGAPESSRAAARARCSVASARPMRRRRAAWSCSASSGVRQLGSAYARVWTTTMPAEPT